MVRKVALSLVVSALVAGAIVAAVRPASSAPGFPRQGVLLADTDGGHPMFGLAPLAPGESRSRCMVVTRYGTTGEVRLYGTLARSGLERFLRLSVVLGSLPSDVARGSCTGFVVQRPLYGGALSEFPETYATGIRELGWSGGQTHAYRLTIGLSATAKVAGLATRASFVWMARP